MRSRLQSGSKHASRKTSAGPSLKGNRCPASDGKHLLTFFTLFITVYT